MPLPKDFIGSVSVDGGTVTARSPAKTIVQSDTLKSVRVELHLESAEGPAVIGFDLDPASFHICQHRGVATVQNAEGRCVDLLPSQEGSILIHGIYRIPLPNKEG